MNRPLILSSAKLEPETRSGPAEISWWDRCRRWWRGEVAPELGEPFGGRAAPTISGPTAAPLQPFRPVRGMSAPAFRAQQASREAASSSFKIQCIPLGEEPTLESRIRAECDRHADDGLALSSTFRHDGHAFLVFKRQ